jgi:hypothetical protein
LECVVKRLSGRGFSTGDIGVISLEFVGAGLAEGQLSGSGELIGLCLDSKSLDFCLVVYGLAGLLCVGVLGLGLQKSDCSLGGVLTFKGLGSECLA